MTKKIGITCDDYKADRFRSGLLAEGFILEFDGPSGVNGAHLFRIEVEASDFDSMQKRISKCVKGLDVDFKRRN